MAVEEEYDVFFADLSEQISLLIMDDEEELHVEFPQPTRQVVIPPSYGLVAAYRRESRGTGVFIPRVIVPRRKDESRKPTRSGIGQQGSKTPPAISHGAHDNRSYVQEYFHNDLYPIQACRAKKTNT